MGAAFCVYGEFMWMICLAIYLIAVNLASFLAFRADKLRAQTGRWRIPERSLLLLAASGGWIGAKRAQKRYRHKTRKQPFAFWLNMVPVLWCALAMVLITKPDVGNWIASSLDWAAGPSVGERQTPRFFTRVSH